MGNKVNQQTNKQTNKQVNKQVIKQTIFKIRDYDLRGLGHVRRFLGGELVG